MFVVVWCVVWCLALLFVFSVKWCELLITSAISCPMWSSMYEFQRVECAFTPPVRTEWGMFVVCCMQFFMSVSAVLVCGYAVSRMYIDVWNCDVFSVVNVYLDHLKLYGVCNYGRRYVCCCECNVVSNECDEPTPCLVQYIGAHGGEVMHFWNFCFRDELGFLSCDEGRVGGVMSVCVLWV